MAHLEPRAFYDAFGITIASEVPLSELRSAEPVTSPDITIKLGAIAQCRSLAGDRAFMDFSDRDAIVMFWPQVAGFQIIGHDTIIVDPHPDVEERFLAFPILGPVLAWILSRKGLFLLHASAIDINGRTAVFMGDKLAGKSTTAAAFVRAGHPLITDDLVAISFEEPGRPMIMPAFAQIKLAADAAAAVTIAGAVAQPLIHDAFPKRQHSLPSMATAPATADWFFTLKRGSQDVALMPMDLSAAIRTFNRFSYMSRFSNANWTAAEDAEHFQNCARLASLAKAGELSVPVGLERLPETVTFVTDLLREDVA